MLISQNNSISSSFQQQEEICWQIPGELARGKISKMLIRSGLELCLVSCTLTNELMFQYRKNLPLLLFTYNLLGKYRVRFDDQETDTKYEGKHLGEYYHGWQVLTSAKTVLCPFQRCIIRSIREVIIYDINCQAFSSWRGR